jgi:hypothetical protein
MLALDGGGIRGVLTLEILMELERVLRRATGKATLRLCDWFDYVAGTSTGAIIAASIARGMEVQEIMDFYQTAGPAMFHKQFLLKQAWSIYDSAPLKEKLQGVFGAKTDLRPENLKCLLLAVTRNINTDSPWPISSNPLAKYNDLTRPDCNLRVPLWQLVRASTAAPVYFPREVIQWDPANPTRTFAFMDGGTTPYNNPAFLLFRMATEPAYRLGWAKGERKLLLVSIGTGGTPVLDPNAAGGDPMALQNLVALVSALMAQAQVDQDISCRTVGRCTFGAPLDNELGDLVPPEPLSQDLGREFLYARYNADLTADGLKQLGLTKVDPKKVQALDSVDAIDDLRTVGRVVAGQVKLDHLGSFAEGD